METPIQTCGGPRQLGCELCETFVPLCEDLVDVLVSPSHNVEDSDDEIHRHVLVE
jgi:hypothetical protein